MPLPLRGAGTQGSSRQVMLLLNGAKFFDGFYDSGKFTCFGHLSERPIVSDDIIASQTTPATYDFEIIRNEFYYFYKLLNLIMRIK